MKTSRLLLIAACSALFFAAACGTGKEASRTPSSASIVPPADATPAVRFEAMTAAYGMWHDLQVPMRATLRSPMNMSASGRLTMVRDSLVHISMRVLGIEVAVLRVGRDSVHVFDKFHRYYAAESMAALSRRTGLTLADVQCALLGRAFMPGRGVATASMASRLRLGGDADYSPAFRARRLHMEHGRRPSWRRTHSAFGAECTARRSAGRHMCLHPGRIAYARRGHGVGS